MALVSVTGVTRRDNRNGCHGCARRDRRDTPPLGGVTSVTSRRCGSFPGSAIRVRNEREIGVVPERSWLGHWTRSPLGQIAGAAVQRAAHE